MRLEALPPLARFLALRALLLTPECSTELFPIRKVDSLLNFADTAEVGVIDDWDADDGEDEEEVVF